MAIIIVCDCTKERQQRIYITNNVMKARSSSSSRRRSRDEWAQRHNGQVHNSVQSANGYRISAVAHKQEDPHKKDNRACYRSKKELETREAKGVTSASRELTVKWQADEMRLQRVALLFFTSSLVWLYSYPDTEMNERRVVEWNL